SRRSSGAVCWSRRRNRPSPASASTGLPIRPGGRSSTRASMWRRGSATTGWWRNGLSCGPKVAAEGRKGGSAATPSREGRGRGGAAGGGGLRSSTDRATRLYAAALGCLGQGDLASRIHLWHDLGSVFQLKGDHDSALGAFERMLRLAWVVASRTKAAVAFN